MKPCYVKTSFYFTYVFLITTGTITFIESLRNQTPQIRHIMNLETCISIVAGYFYGVFLKEIDDAEKESEILEKGKQDRCNGLDSRTSKETEQLEESSTSLPINKINTMRYSDWVITTPLMILGLSILLGYENKIGIKISSLFLLFAFNFLMLLSGYFGEIGKISRIAGTTIGFIFFFLLFGTIWKLFMTGSKVTSQSKIVFWLYFGIWSLYGVFYQTDELTKMIGYNILDLCAKAFIGLFFWLYLAKIVKI
jgi:bacteriorhodopsin